MEKDSNEFLPLIPEENLLAPIMLENTHNLDAVRKADIQLFNNQLAMLAALFANVHSVKTALELHDRLMEMIPRRRALMGYEYGSTANKGSKAHVFEPVD